MPVTSGTHNTHEKCAAVFARLTSVSNKQLMQRDILFRAGNSADYLFLLHSGFIKLTKLHKAGEPIAVSLRTRGALIGIESVITGMPYTYDAIALGDTIVISVPTEIVRLELRQNGDFARAMEQAMALQLIDDNDDLASRGTNALMRLKRILFRLMPISNGPNVNVRLPFCYKDLAHLIGVTPEHLSRMVTRLEHRRFLTRDRYGFVLRNPVNALPGAKDRTDSESLRRVSPASYAASTLPQSKNNVRQYANDEQTHDTPAHAIANSVFASRESRRPPQSDCERRLKTRDSVAQRREPSHHRR